MALTGDLSEPVALRDPNPDYMFRPIVPGAVEIVLLVVSVAMVLASIAFLVVERRARRMDRKWVAPIVLLSMAGVVVAFGWWVMTAATIGANIGGGLVILFGGPLVLGLVIAAAWNAQLPPLGGSRR